MKKFLIISVIIIVIIVGFFVFRDEKKVEYSTAKVERGELVQTVSETGTVKASKEINLGFLLSGKISSIKVDIGDKIKKDQILAELDYGSLKIQEKDANARLNVAQANLDKLLTGATTYEINVSQAGVDQAYANYLASLEELEKTQNAVDENIAQALLTLSDLESDSSDTVTPSEQAVETARTTLNNTKATYSQSVNNYKNSALVTIEDKIAAANTALDAIIRILDDDDAQGVLSVQDPSYLTNTENTHEQSGPLLDQAEQSLNLAKQSKTKDDINNALDDCLELLQKVYESLNYCYGALEKTISTYSFTQSEVDSFKSTISSHLTTINTGISSVQTAKQNLADAVLAYDTNVAQAEESLTNAEANLEDAIKTARNNLSSARVNGDQQIAMTQAKVDNALEAWNLAKAQLDQVKSPARSQDISLYRAQVEQAEASLELIQKQIDDSIIRAPIDGTVVKVNYEEGEQVTMTSANMSEPVIAILGENDFDIEIDISEADISKVRIGDPVEITLDAFGEDIKFSGIVHFIEPAETVIQDVIYYKVTVEFVNGSKPNNGYSNIKSGMTANATITTARKNQVLIMPGRAVLEKNGGDRYTRLLINEEPKEVKVKIGLRGDGGMVEVLEGVKEGDVVVTSVKELD